jgi:XRE family transcriptional regulator, fatty acid utilization regulator
VAGGTAEEETLAQRLRRLREDRLMTQAELAQKAGISPWTISQIENSAQLPRFSTIRKLAQALEVPPRELAGSARR